MDIFESELIARLRTSNDQSAKKFLKWLDKNPTGPIRKRRLAKLKADARHILKEGGGDKKLESLGEIDWNTLFSQLLAFIKAILSLFL